VEDCVKSSKGLKKLRLWIAARTKFEKVAKADYAFSKGITKALIQHVRQSNKGPFRGAPSRRETQSVFLLAVLSRLNPSGHDFFNEVINVGGVPVVLDYIDRLHVRVPNKILRHAVITLSK